jgi:hypothetical protein
MTTKEKYELFDKTKINEKVLGILKNMQESSKNFTDESVNSKIDSALDKLIENFRANKPEALLTLPEAKKEVKKEKEKAIKKNKDKDLSEKKDTDDETGLPKKDTLEERKDIIKEESETEKEARDRAKKELEKEKEKAKDEVESQIEKLNRIIMEDPALRGFNQGSSALGGKGLGGKSNPLIDAERKALPRGSRVSQKGWKNQYGASDGGRKYYENRENRTDRKSPDYETGKPYLAKGGNVYSSDEMYLIAMFKGDVDLDTISIRAKNKAEARMIFEDTYRDKYEDKLGDFAIEIYLVKPFPEIDSYASGGVIKAKKVSDWDWGKIFEKVNLGLGQSFVTILPKNPDGGKIKYGLIIRDASNQFDRSSNLSYIFDLDDKYYPNDRQDVKDTISSPYYGKDEYKEIARGSHFLVITIQGNRKTLLKDLIDKVSYTRFSKINRRNETDIPFDYPNRFLYDLLVFEGSISDLVDFVQKLQSAFQYEGAKLYTEPTPYIMSIIWNIPQIIHYDGSVITPATYIPIFELANEVEAKTSKKRKYADGGETGFGSWESLTIEKMQKDFPFDLNKLNRLLKDACENRDDADITNFQLSWMSKKYNTFAKLVYEAGIYLKSTGSDNVSPSGTYHSQKGLSIIFYLRQTYQSDGSMSSVSIDSQIIVAGGMGGYKSKDVENYYDIYNYISSVLRDNPKNNLGKFTYAEGGEVEGVDLFEDYDDQPEEVQAILANYEMEDNDYETLQNLKAELESIGYTMDFGLDAEPYDLRKIGEKGKSEFYAKGGKLNTEVILTENRSNGAKWRGVVKPFMMKSIERNQYGGGFKRYEIDIYDDVEREPSKEELKQANEFFDKVGGRFAKGGLTKTKTGAIKLYYHQTSGGAEYLCSSKVKGTKDEGSFDSEYIVRIDGAKDFGGELQPKGVKLYYHQTSGGAEYLCSSKVKGTKDEGSFDSEYIVRIDGAKDFGGELLTKVLPYAKGSEMADGGMMEARFDVTIYDEDGEKYYLITYAEDEEDAIRKAENYHEIESVDSDVMMITDYDGKNLYFAKGGEMADGGKLEEEISKIKSLGGDWQSYYKGAKAGMKDDGYVTIENEADLIDYIYDKTGYIVKNIEVIEKGKNYPLNNSNPYFYDTYLVTLKNGSNFTFERSYGRPNWQGNVNYIERIKITNINTKHAKGDMFAEGGQVGDFFYDLRKDKAFQVIFEDGDKMGIQYLGMDKKPVGGVTTITKNEFEYNVEKGSWGKWKQEYAKGGEMPDGYMDDETLLHEFKETLMDTDDLQRSIKEYYVNAFPTDEEGFKIEPEANFSGLNMVLNEGDDVYEYLNVSDAELKHLKDSEEYDYILDARDIERYESGRYTPKGENYEYVNTFNRYDTNIPVPQEDFEKLVDAYHKQLSGDKLDIAKYDVLKQQMGNYLGHETINEMESYISKRHNSNKYAKGGEMAHGGGVPYKPYGKTKGRFKLTYKVEGEPQNEIRESLEEATDSARRYVNPKLGYTNVHIHDESGKEYFFADGGYTESGEKLYEIANNMSDKEFQEAFRNLSEKEKDLYESLLRLGDESKIALATVLNESKKPKYDKLTWDLHRYEKGGEMAKGGITPQLNEKVYAKAQEILKAEGITENISQKQFNQAYDKAIKEFGYSPAYFKKVMREFGPEYPHDDDTEFGDFMADGGKIELYYVKDSNGHVKNISKTYEDANKFLEKGLKYNGNIGYALVPKDDWENEKVTVSTIKRYAGMMTDGGETDNSLPDRMAGFFPINLLKDAYVIKEIKYSKDNSLFTDDYTVRDFKNDFPKEYHNVTLDEAYKLIDELNNTKMADGGEVDFIERMAKMRSAYENLNMIVKSKIAIAVGIDRAISIMENDYSIDPFSLIISAVRGGLLELDEINKDLVNEAVSEAENVTDDYRDSGQGISGSDMTVFTKNVLDSAGYKTGFINNRLERVDEEGNKLEIDKYNMNY